MPSDTVDEIDHLANALRGFRQRAHRSGNQIGIAHRIARNPARFLHLAGDAGDRAAEFVCGARDILHEFRSALRCIGDVARLAAGFFGGARHAKRGRFHIVGEAADFLHDMIDAILKALRQFIQRAALHFGGAAFKGFLFLRQTVVIDGLLFEHVEGHGHFADFIGALIARYRHGEIARGQPVHRFGDRAERNGNTARRKDPDNSEHRQQKRAGNQQRIAQAIDIGKHFRRVDFAQERPADAEHIDGPVGGNHLGIAIVFDFMNAVATFERRRNRTRLDMGRENGVGPGETRHRAHHKIGADHIGFAGLAHARRIAQNLIHPVDRQLHGEHAGESAIGLKHCRREEARRLIAVRLVGREISHHDLARLGIIADDLQQFGEVGFLERPRAETGGEIIVFRDRVDQIGAGIEQHQIAVTRFLAHSAQPRMMLDMGGAVKIAGLAIVELGAVGLIGVIGDEGCLQRFRSLEPEALPANREIVDGTPHRRASRQHAQVSRNALKIARNSRAARLQHRV